MRVHAQSGTRRMLRYWPQEENSHVSPFMDGDGVPDRVSADSRSRARAIAVAGGDRRRAGADGDNEDDRSDQGARSRDLAEYETRNRAESARGRARFRR